ncbi:S-adenosyl-L-methionine-dependent methyltransferases superfamily protein [Wolffia australiana]
MERSLASSRASSLRWKLLREALQAKSSALPAEDGSPHRNTNLVSRRTSSHFNMIPGFCISGNIFGDSEVPREIRNPVSERDVIILYKLPSETSPSLYLMQRMERGIDLRDFEISNRFNIDNTGLICSWPSEDVLAYFCLKKKHMFSGKKVIELGSGYGLAGLTIAVGTDACEVIISDGNPQVVDYLRHNIKNNKKSFGDTKATAVELHWDQELPQSLLHSFDLVIASDCTFFKEYHEALAVTLKSLLRTSEGSAALVLSPRRGDSIDKFLARVNAIGLSSEIVENYDPEVWRRHIQFLNGEDQSWPNYDKDHCYPLLITLFPSTFPGTQFFL